MQAIDLDIKLNTFMGLLKKALVRYGFWGSFARYIMLKDKLHKFLNSTKSIEDRKFRKQLLKDFSKIHRNIPCAHSPYQIVLMAEYILNLKIDGPIVECGCFRGGSAAQLSLLAKRTNRRLYICDSFQGLPDAGKDSEYKLEGLLDNRCDLSFSAGDYAGSLEEVKNNIKKFGVLDVCEFVPGFFNESLSALEIEPAFIYIDVDLVSSARDCLKFLWPRLKKGGCFFTHEAIFSNYISGILDLTWWEKNLKEYPPVVWGAGSGLSELAAIAYFQKK